MLALSANNGQSGVSVASRQWTPYFCFVVMHAIQLYILQRGNGSGDIKSAFLPRGASWATHAKFPVDGNSRWNTGDHGESKVIGEELLLGRP